MAYSLIHTVEKEVFSAVRKLLTKSIIPLEISEKENLIPTLCRPSSQISFHHQEIVDLSAVTSHEYFSRNHIIYIIYISSRHKDLVFKTTKLFIGEFFYQLNRTDDCTN